MPSTDWSVVGPRGHAVQFYRTDGQLFDLLTRFIGTALVVGDAAIVIATRAHRDGLAKRLRARGMEATLARFTRDGRIDPALFQQVVGGVMAAAARGSARRRVVAFGEMVAVLWSEGRHESAIQLEQMWNDLAHEHEFALCCAYPMSGFGNRHAAPFMKICAQHSHVFTVQQAGDATA
jgi:hypothetical protein